MPPKNILYLVSTKDGHELRYRWGHKKYREALEKIMQEGDSVIRSFKVPNSLLGKTIDLCEYFLSGTIRPSSLDRAVKNLYGEKYKNLLI